MTLSANPVYTRLTRNTLPPSLRMTFWITFAGSILSLGWLLFTSHQAIVRQEPSFLLSIGDTLRSVVKAASYILPASAGVIGALITSHDTSGEVWMLLRTTSLSGWRLATGYLAVVLHRLRLPLAAMAWVLPVLLIVSFSYMAGTLIDNAHHGELHTPPDFDVLLFCLDRGLIPALLWWAGIVGLVFLTTAIGIWVGIYAGSVTNAIVGIGLCEMLILLTLGLVRGPLPSSIDQWFFALIGWLVGPPVLWLAAISYDRMRRS